MLWKMLIICPLHVNSFLFKIYIAKFEFVLDSMDIAMFHVKWDTIDCVKSAPHLFDIILIDIHKYMSSWHILSCHVLYA